MDDSRHFDLERYRALMSRYVDPSLPENRLFYDALEFSHGLHEGQYRKSGAPYITHPCAVAEVLAKEWHIRDPELLAAALLHDVVEDVAHVTLEDVEKRFGKMVAELVDGCTKLTRYRMDRAALKNMTYRKFFWSASRQLGVFVVKLADRLHNLRTLHYMPKSKRQRIAQETVEVYAPVAAKLSIFSVKRELYKLALSFLYPKKSRKILHALKQFRETPSARQSEEELHAIFADFPPSVEVRPRIKGLGSYYNPLRRTLDLANSENHLDFTLVVDSPDPLDCYTALGRVANSSFSPMRKTLRDFIASPKNNGYRSLHLRVHMGEQTYLVKIRTREMHRRATHGILYEWDPRDTLDENHYWKELSEFLRELGEYGGAGPQRKDLIRLSETDQEIFAFTPLGDVHYFPQRSVVLDFAYKIHSQLGDYCRGARVNRQLKSPLYELRDGDVVEILTSREPLDVDPDLEGRCRTPRARTAINRLVQQKLHAYALDAGRRIVEQELHRYGVSPEVLEGEWGRLIFQILNIKDAEDLCVQIGQHRISPHVLGYYLSGDSSPDPGGKAPAGTISGERNVLEVGELDKAIHKFAQCCNPYPAQQGVVAALSERGVAFHRRDCEVLEQELTRRKVDPSDLLEVKWVREPPWRHVLSFHLHASGETVSSLCAFLAGLPSSIVLRKLERAESRAREKATEMVVDLRSYAQAEAFFKALPDGKTLVERYSRKERLRR